jgi:hypothetical protein
MTDKTPHESLPLQNNANRQYFRLVVGTITTWFADHCTANPLGVLPPDTVNIIRGNKFHMFNTTCTKWISGTNKEIQKLKDENAVRELAFRHGLGHMSERLIEFGLTNFEKILEFASRNNMTNELGIDGQFLFLEKRFHYYDYRVFEDNLLPEVKSILQVRNKNKI